MTWSKDVKALELQHAHEAAHVMGEATAERGTSNL